MGFISDNFGTYTAYKAWTDGQVYLYHYILRYNSTFEILKINPGGTTEAGLEIIEHETYLGRFTTLSIGLRFPYKTGGGGDILRDDLYKVTGKKSECTIEKYKLNPDTKDFDLDFTGIFDFKTYKDDVDENGARFITGNIVEESDFQKLTARDELKLNLFSNTSVGGVTITDIPTDSITIPAVNYYLQGSALSGALSATASYSSSGTHYYYYASGITLTDQTSGRFDFGTLTGRIYDNSTDETKQLKGVFDFDYFVSTNCGIGSSLTMRYQLISYTSTGTPITTRTLQTLTNTAEGVKTETGNVSVEYDYSIYSIPAGGYLLFVLRVDAVKGAGLCDLNAINFQDDRSFYFYEKSPSFGSSDVDMMRVYNAFFKSMRLMMDRNDCFESDFLSDSGNEVYHEYIASIRDISSTLDPWLPVSFKELFLHVRSIWGIALDYDNTTNRFKVVLDSDLYTTTARLDLGTIKNCKLSTLQYPSEIKTGFQQEGDIDGLQGVNVTHLSATHALDTPDDGVMDIRGKYIMSAYVIEANRRKQFSDKGQNDTKDDDKIAYVYTDSGTVVTVGDTVPPYLQGFEGIDEIYNPITTPRRNILRNRIIRGFFKYDSGGSVRFVSNKKNVNYLHLVATPYYEQDDIPASSLRTALYIPEQIEGELTFTPAIKSAIDSNIYGVWTVTDEAGQEYEIHLTKVVFKDFLKTINITAKLHNS
jgi:hypothetical protein